MEYNGNVKLWPVSLAVTIQVIHGKGKYNLERKYGGQSTGANVYHQTWIEDGYTQ